MPLAESAARPAPGRRLPFSVDATDPGTSARAGALTTPHGVVRTPAFMPVGTAGTVKGITGWQLEDLAPQMVLANTYHLLLRPGSSGWAGWAVCTV
jgi:queuine tRNA-ribosyltransferase